MFGRFSHRTPILFNFIPFAFVMCSYSTLKQTHTLVLFYERQQQCCRIRGHFGEVIVRILGFFLSVIGNVMNYKKEKKLEVKKYFFNA